MKKISLSNYLIIIVSLFLLSLTRDINSYKPSMGSPNNHYSSAKPFTRWWWFASIIDTNDIKFQLDWLKSNNFGGVEVAWVYPLNGANTPRIGWLSPEWSSVVTFTKKYCDKLGLGCDFTFGTLWPFGDSKVPPKDGSLQYKDTISPFDMNRTWEYPIKGRVINHMDKNALIRYSQRIGTALSGAMKGNPSSIFCDSWEVETNGIWTKGFDTAFKNRYHYDIKPYMDSLLKRGYANYFYDYMKLVSEYVLNNFYSTFTDISHKLGGFSRIQCGGSPTDLLLAFNLADYPETEAILFEPNFAKIPVSAAVLGSKSIVSSETFTCIYGWQHWPGPGAHQKKEQAADLKLVADALFANGVNQIFWHGMPYNPKGGSNMFYASVHVGPDSYFADELPSFNNYLTKISTYMRKGVNYSDVAVYLPLEDSWMGVEYPDSLKFPWVWGQYEQRYLKTPDELKGYQPLWINSTFLKKGVLRDGKLYCGDAAFSSLYVDAQYLDVTSLKIILDLAQKGFPVCLKRTPMEPGVNKSKEYNTYIYKIKSLRNVSSKFAQISKSEALLSGNNLPDFWCRNDHDDLYIFFPHPKSYHLKYPIKYGQSLVKENIVRDITLNWGAGKQKLQLTFTPYHSLLLKVDKYGVVKYENLDFTPKTPNVN